MITFDRKAGTLTFGDGHVEHGIWSGHGDAANDPSRERDHMIGPLPGGMYRMLDPRTSPQLGTYVLDLTPFPANEMFGRSLFRIHGDTVNDANHAASDGCIIAQRLVRERCNAELDHLLKVV